MYNSWVEETNRFNFLLIGKEILDSRSETDKFQYSSIPSSPRHPSITSKRYNFYNEEFDTGSG